MTPQTKQHRNDFRQADAIRFGKVAEMRAKVEAGTADLQYKRDIAFARMMDAITPRVISDEENEAMDELNQTCIES